MKNKLKEYVALVLESIDSIDGPYTTDILDDESFTEKSALVPDDIKRKISKYFKSMGLSRSKKKSA